ncbi:MAG: hypothetical protein DRR08_20555 [Candidatus Parabeggiatoa sp. nov. 2]|nr:MAG: hypothetical protein B6247_26885 [Beggiatoa sp. 4572_84]RKZ56856.1 MAG: hypothetical protein DRR08_20555 [Gammaproteobacteria bacterium]
MVIIILNFHTQPIMLTSYMKLSLVILLGAMTLGVSFVAVAKDDFVATNWIGRIPKKRVIVTA